MFHDLSVYNKILVTGAARSGTHICAKMVAHDTGHTFIPEGNFKAHNLAMFSSIYYGTDQFVVPCNGMIHYISEFGFEDTMVICMLRPVGEIMLSGWRIKGRLSGMDYHEARALVLGRYETWEKQKADLKNWEEVHYYELELHPLWIPKEERLNFHPTQTTRGVKL